jgi:predicted RNase H-like HicB family nuclease
MIDVDVSAVYYETEGWWVGYVLEVPGVNTQGRSLEEAKENMKEALDLAIEARSHLGLPATEPIVRDSIHLRAS